jgi:hypothetical protein
MHMFLDFTVMLYISCKYAPRCYRILPSLPDAPQMPSRSLGALQEFLGEANYIKKLPINRLSGRYAIISGKPM